MQIPGLSTKPSILKKNIATLPYLQTNTQERDLLDADSEQLDQEADKRESALLCSYDHFLSNPDIRALTEEIGLKMVKYFLSKDFE